MTEVITQKFFCDICNKETPYEDVTKQTFVLGTLTGHDGPKGFSVRIKFDYQDRSVNHVCRPCMTRLFVEALNTTFNPK